MILNKTDLGRFIRICFSDVGAKDGILISVDNNHKEVKVYFPGDDYITNILKEQIMCLGPSVMIPRF